MTDHPTDGAPDLLEVARTMAAKRAAVADHYDRTGYPSTHGRQIVATLLALVAEIERLREESSRIQARELHYLNVIDRHGLKLMDWPRWIAAPFLHRDALEFCLGNHPPDAPCEWIPFVTLAKYEKLEDQVRKETP